MDWDYADITHEAKLAGGPDEYRENLRDEGRMEGVPIGALITLGAVCVGMAAKCLIDRWRNRNAVSREETADTVESHGAGRGVAVLDFPELAGFDPGDTCRLLAGGLLHTIEYKDAFGWSNEEVGGEIAKTLYAGRDGKPTKAVLMSIDSRLNLKPADMDTIVESIRGKVGDAATILTGMTDTQDCSIRVIEVQ